MVLAVPKGVRGRIPFMLAALVAASLCSCAGLRGSPSARQAADGEVLPEESLDPSDVQESQLAELLEQEALLRQGAGASQRVFSVTSPQTNQPSAPPLADTAQGARSGPVPPVGGMRPAKESLQARAGGPSPAADVPPPSLSARESAAPVERPGDRGVTAGTVTSNSTVQSMDDPRIRPGHVLDIRVVVSGVTEVDESAKRVSSTGHLSLVLVGKVDVNGLTLPQLADRLEKLYGRYMREPMVDVSFVVDQSPGAVSPWGYVTVLGSVKHPGRINIPPTQDLTLSMAVQLAGGLGESARDTAIKVTRRNGADPAATLNVNLRSAASEGAVENDLPLQAGDVIYVPEKVF